MFPKFGRRFLSSCLAGSLAAAMLLTGSGCDSSGSGQTANLVAAWPLNDGGTGTTVASELEKGVSGEQKWGVWLNNQTFGKSLDFSTKGSNVYIQKSGVNLKKEFAISLWAMAPVREEGDRVLMMQGAPADGTSELDGFRLYLDGENNHELAFEASGMTGLETSGVSLTDGKWHHILVSCEKGKLTYYIDGENVKTVDASGSAQGSTQDLFLGSDTAGENGFDGTMAQVRIYNRAKSPADVTSTVLNTADNEPQSPFLNLKKGIVIDRRQYIQPEPLPSEGQTVTENDIINCINMGFDHVKLLLTPNHLIDDEGGLIRESLEYITRVLGYVKDHNFRCILCIHPEQDFKPRYLKNLENFEELIRWYGELAAWIGENWGPETVALQLMTEPAENNQTVTWSWMSDRMWGAVRNVLPQHTILTSSDGWGHLERLKDMSPASDSNLIYTFTTYEPYTIGWYYYGTTPDQLTGWSYVKDIPYPVEEGVDYTDAIENAIELVPDSLKSQMREMLTAYVNGEYDGQRQDRPNLYGVPYGPEWHMKRAESLDQWRQKYGGNIHIMCVEFGCMDAETPKVLWRSAVDGSGISPEVRLQFTKDMRSSFDAYDIGWSYWSYNEAHTIFQIDAHSYGTSPDPEVAANMFDYEMLEEGLGVTPLVEPGEIVTIETDPDWLVIDNFESVGSWYGTGLQVSNDNAPSGYGWLRTESVDAGNAAVFANALPQKKDVSAYSNGYLHVWVYVEDIEKITGGQIELCSSGVPDMYETSWDLKKYVTSSGWNELYLPLADASTGQKAADLKAIDFIRIYALVTEAMPVGVDQMYLCTKMP